LEFPRDEYMRRLIAPWPPGGEAVDHVPDMAICLDQFRQIFRWQIEPGLASQQNDFIVGWRCGHGETPGYGLVRVWPDCGRCVEGLPKEQARPVPGAGSGAKPCDFKLIGGPELRW
jgi:hypothetical protein